MNDDKNNFGGKLRELAAAAKDEPEKHLWSKDRTRYAQRVFFGYACYSGYVSGEDFHGHKVGVCSRKEQADAWVNGGDAADPFIEMAPFPPA
jgi:hypothetical protein